MDKPIGGGLRFIGGDGRVALLPGWPRRRSRTAGIDAERERGASRQSGARGAIGGVGRLAGSVAAC